MTINLNDKIRQLEKQLSQNNDSRSQRYYDGLYELGEAYLESGRQPEGLQCFYKRVEIKPDDAFSHCSLGWAYLHLGHFSQALASYTQACELSPGLIKAVSGQTDAYYRLGDIESAYRNIQNLFSNQSVSKVNDCASALRVYSKICDQFDVSEECIQTIQYALNKAKPSTETRKSLFYALAMLFDKSKKYQEAYQYYSQANELSRHNYSYQDERKKNNVIMSSFSSGRIPASLQKNSASLEPVFILGMPRSGTSLIEQILSKHSDVFAGGELTTLTEISNVLFSQCNYPFTLENINENVLTQAANHYFSTTNKMVSGKRMITDKMPANFMHLGLISLLFPDATVIHAQRNPLDTCLSIYFQSFPGTHSYATSLKNIAQYYIEYKRLMDHWQSVLSIQFHNVYYEQLVAQQEKKTRELLSSCHLEWNVECLDFYKSSRVVVTASQEQVKQKMYNSSVHRWKNYQAYLPKEFTDLLANEQESYLKLIEE